MQGSSLTEIRKLADEVSVREGCYLYDIEMVGAGSTRVLRVTIDKDGEGGVSVEDCSNVSRAMNLRLDVEDIIPGGPYQLEVSSPGLERVLKEPRHYQGAIGKVIAVKSFAPLAQFNPVLPIELSKAKQLQGPLLSFDDNGIKVGYAPTVKKGADPLPQVEVALPYETITKANVVFVFEEKAKAGPKTPVKPHPKSPAGLAAAAAADADLEAAGSSKGGSQK